MDIKYDIFISYSRADQKIAEGLCGYLENNNLRCFIDYRDIPRGAIWARVLPDAIRHSGMMVAIFSENYNKSMQVERELSIADKAGLPVLPFRIADVPYEGLKSYYFESINWIDAFPNPEVVFGKLLTDIQALKEATENWHVGRNPAAGGVTINLDSIDSDIEQSNDLIDPTYEDDYNDGVDAIQNLEYADAFSYLLEPALANYRKSQNYMSWIASKHYSSLIPKNTWNYIRQKADEGNAFAEYLLARYYSFVDIDDNQAFEWASRSARQGNIYGRFTLAKLYDLGLGAEQDNSMGIDKIKELERMDIGAAMRELARHYIYGFTGRKNPRRGIKILERGVDLGIPECIWELGCQKLYGDAVQADVEEGRALLKQAIDDGIMEAMDVYANSFLFDYNTGEYLNDPASYRKFMEITNRGVKLKNSMSINTLASHYRSDAGIGLKTDFNTALKWYTRAAELGNLDAAVELGRIYYYGEDSVSADEPKAWEWFTRAAKGCQSYADYNLGIMCLDGYGQNGETKHDCVSHFENAVFLAGYGGGLAASMLYGIFVPEGFEDGFPTSPQKHYDVPGYDKDLDKTLDVLRKGANCDNGICSYLLGCALTDTSRPYANEIEGIEYLEKAIRFVDHCYDAALRLYDLYSDGIGIPADKQKADEYLAIARENLSAETVDNFLKNRGVKAPSKSAPTNNTVQKTAPTRAEAEAAKAFYDKAEALCYDTASAWELMQALSYISKATALGYEPAKELKTKALKSLRVYFDNIALEARPDFRLMGRMLHAPWLNTPVNQKNAAEVLNGPDGATVKSKWSELLNALKKFGITGIPALTPDLGANAATLARVWSQLLKKEPDLRAKGFSPLDLDEMLEQIEDATDLNTTLLSFCECMIELDDVIVKAQCK